MTPRRTRWRLMALRWLDGSLFNRSCSPVDRPPVGPLLSKQVCVSRAAAACDYWLVVLQQ